MRRGDVLKFTRGSAPSKVNGSVSYGLDPVGNRLSTTSTISGINSGSLSFNPDDQVLIESYDADANTTATGGKSFAYDSEDRLKSMNGGAVTITYDGDGNRVAKTVNGATTHYLIDDLNPTGYAQVVEETGSAQRVYTYGLQRIDEYQVINSAWTPSFYGYDGMGTVRTLTNAAGSTTDTNEYDAFGNLIDFTGTTPNVYLYRGEEYDSDLGLYYLRARYYNPLTGRFMSRDPESGKIGYPKTLHKYSYAADDPVNGSDPSGKDDEIEYQFLFSSVEKGPIFPGIAGAGITGTKIVAAGTAVAVLARFVGSAFGIISEALELSLGPDLHDPGKPEPGNPNEPEPAPISSGP